MTWLAAIGVAIAAFAMAAFALGLGRSLWSSMLAALALGLAGYAFQASPGLPSAAKTGSSADDGPMFDLVDARLEMLGAQDRSSSDLMQLADAMTRRGRYVDAAKILAGATRDNPGDFEAWLAQANVLVEHTDGVLTPPALYAYRQAAMLKPSHIAPNYFLGVSLIRQGRMMEARQIWRDALDQAAPDAPGRGPLDDRLVRLETMLGLMAAEGGEAAPADGAPAPADMPQQGG